MAAASGCPASGASGPAEPRAGKTSTGPAPALFASGLSGQPVSATGLPRALPGRPDHPQAGSTKRGVNVPWLQRGGGMGPLGLRRSGLLPSTARAQTLGSPGWLPGGCRGRQPLPAAPMRPPPTAARRGLGERLRGLEPRSSHAWKVNPVGGSIAGLCTGPDVQETCSPATPSLLPRGHRRDGALGQVRTPLTISCHWFYRVSLERDSTQRAVGVHARSLGPYPGDPPVQRSPNPEAG